MKACCRRGGLVTVMNTVEMFGAIFDRIFTNDLWKKSYNYVSKEKLKDRVVKKAMEKGMTNIQFQCRMEQEVEELKRVSFK